MSLTGQEFAALLSECQKAQDPSVRKEVEAKYFEIKKTQPAFYAQTMVQIICTDPTLSSYAAILFRRDLEQNGSEASLFLGDDKALSHGLVLQIMNVLVSNQSNSEIRFLADIVGVYAETVLSEDSKSFPEVFELFQTHLSATHATPLLRGAVLTVMKYICQIQYSVLKNMDFPSILNVIRRGLQDPTDSVAVHAISCINNLVLYNSDDDDEEDAEPTDSIPQKVVNELISAIVSRIAVMLKNNSIADAEKALEELVDLTDVNGQALAPLIDQVHNLVNGILSSQLDDCIKKLAVVIFGYMCENISGIKKKSKTLIQSVLLNYIIPSIGKLDDEDTEAWATSADPDAFNDDSSLPSYCEDCLDRVSNALGKSIILPVLQEFTQATMAAPSWNNCLALASSFSVAAEGMSKTITIPEITQICDILIGLSTNPHPRVKFAVITAIGQMSDDFAPMIQTLHAKLLPLLIQMSTDPCIRVSAHAPAAMINYIEPIEMEDLYPYVADICKVVDLHLNRSSDIISQTNAFTIIASLAGTLEKADFIPIIQQFMNPILMKFTEAMSVIRANPNNVLTSVQIGFISRLVECLSIISENVPELFADYVDPLLTSIKELFSFSIDDDDHSLTKFSLFALARIASSYPEKFSHFLGSVMPILFDILNSSYIQMSSAETLDNDDNNFVINPHVLQQQAVSFSAISNIMKTQPVAFAPYLSKFLEIVNAKSFHSSAMTEYIRIHCVDCICFALKVAFESGTLPVAEVHASVFPLIVAASEAYFGEIESYEDFTVSLNEYTRSYCKYVAATNELGSFEPTVSKIIEILGQLEAKAHADVKELIENLNADDDEDDDAERNIGETLESMIDALHAISDVYATFVSELKDNCLGFFPQLIMPVVSKWITDGTTKLNADMMCMTAKASKGKGAAPTPQLDDIVVGYMTSGIGVLADVVDYLSPEKSIELVRPFIGVLIQCTRVQNDFMSIPHVCCFVCGLMCERYPAEQAIVAGVPTLITNAQAIISLVEGDVKSDSAALNAHDNAVTMLSKIAKAFPAQVATASGNNVESFWGYWLNAASRIRTDIAEVVVCIRVIVEAFGRNDPLFIGANLAGAVTALTNLFFGQNHSEIIDDKDNADLLTQIGAIVSSLMAQGDLLTNAVASGSDYVKKNFTLYTKK